ncbi:MAG: hypothetical protein QXK88_00750 [Desulfurococcaceae archaeon]
MAYTWEPRWELFEVDHEGIRFRTCRDKITGLISCPICAHAASKCLGETPPVNYKYENSFFYSVEDLIEHIKGYHLFEQKKRVEKLLSSKAEDES